MRDFRGQTKTKAYSVFMKIIENFHEAEKKIQDFTREEPMTRKDWQGKNVRGENISFDEKNFLRWLLTGKAYKVEDWLQDGEILKWFAEYD